MSDEKRQSPLHPGGFKGPTDNPPRKAPAEPLQRKDEVSETDDEAATPDDKLEELSKEMNRPLTPAELQAQYLKGLDAVGLEVQEARTILDTVLVNEFYEENYKVGGRLPVVFRTRTYFDVQRTLRLAEAEAPNLSVHIDDLIARYNLAASLSKYNDRVFNFPTRSTEVSDKDIEDAFEERLNFILGLATPVIARLNVGLMQFDRKLNAVFADGAPEDF